MSEQRGVRLMDDGVYGCVCVRFTAGWPGVIAVFDIEK